MWKGIGSRGRRIRSKGKKQINGRWRSSSRDTRRERSRQSSSSVRCTEEEAAAAAVGLVVGAGGRSKQGWVCTRRYCAPFTPLFRTPEHKWSR